MASSRSVLIAAQPLHGGVANHVVDLVVALPKDEFDVSVACPRESMIWRRLDGLEGVSLYRIQPEREPALADARTLAVLLPLVRRVDLVHAHSSKAGFLARLAASTVGRRRRCIFTPHGWSFWSARGMQARFYVGLERVAAHWCRTLVALSNAERAAGLDLGVGHESQYRVIPNGVDTDHFAVAPDPIPGRVVFIGRLAAPKRIDLVLQAFASVRRTFPQAQLHVVGDGPDRARAAALLEGHGLNDAVRLLGAVDDVSQVLSRAACVVLASDYEGCPLSVIEAMAAGVPVVATKVGGVPELVEDGRTGLLVPAGRARGIAEGLIALLADPERARRLGDEGRRVARERFSRARMVDELRQLYEEVAAG